MHPNDDQIILIDAIFPELIIDRDSSSRFHWHFRCTSSENYEDTEAGWSTPVEAVAAFAKYLSDEQDAMMADEDDDEDEWNGYVERRDSWHNGNFGQGRYKEVRFELLAMVDNQYRVWFDDKDFSIIKANDMEDAIAQAKAAIDQQQRAEAGECTGN